MQGGISQQGVLTKLSQLLQQKQGEGDADDPQHPGEIPIPDRGNQLTNLGGQQGP